MKNLRDQWHAYPTLDKTQILMALFTILTFISVSTIGAVQGCQTREALWLTETSNRETKSSNEFQEKITRLGTRAYLGIEDPTVHIEKGHPFLVSVIVKNFGKSPAGHVYICGSLLSDPRAIDTVLSLDKDICERHKITDNVLIPGSSFQRTFKFADSLAMADAATIRKMDLPFVLGRLVFTDVFNEEHFVEFCYFYNPFLGRYLVHDKGNNAH